MKIISLLAFFVFSLIINSNEQNDWELIRNRNNVEVYSRPVENKNDRELKAITIVDSDLSNLLAIIYDVEYYPNWVYRASEAEILNTVSETEFYYYQVTDAPWPITDRDMIIHVKVSQDEVSREITVKFTGVPDYMEEKPGFVRVPSFNGNWVFTPLEDGTVRVVHSLLIEPEGEIPSWIVNSAAVEGPYSTLLNMRRLINEDRFAKRSFDFLIERS